jgi:hypothetical protein
MNLILLTYISLKWVQIIQGDYISQINGIFGKLFLLIAAFIVVKNGLYYLVGSIFFSKDTAEQWIHLNQLVLTFFLVVFIPVFLIFQSYHSYSFEEACVWLLVGATMEKGCCIVLRRKIFLTKPYSYVYLILYLCTLEILPVLLFIKGLYLVS